MYKSIGTALNSSSLTRGSNVKQIHTPPSTVHASSYGHEKGQEANDATLPSAGYIATYGVEIGRIRLVADLGDVGRRLAPQRLERHLVEEAVRLDLVGAVDAET